MLHWYRCNKKKFYFAAWQGVNCSEDVNECKDDYICKNNGRCINVIGTYFCKCRPQFSGMRCEFDVDECLDDFRCTSISDSYCVNLIGSFICKCKNGTRSNTFTKNGIEYKECLDIDECLNNPCKFEGECKNTIGSFRCICKKGFSGHVCQDILECSLFNPCQNYGVCKSDLQSNSAKCTCKKGFKGSFCEHNDETEGKVSLCQLNFLLSKIKTLLDIL